MYVVRCKITGLYAMGQFCNVTKDKAQVFKTKADAKLWIRSGAPFENNFEILEK
jgi:hypothetical protein